MYKVVVNDGSIDIEIVVPANGEGDALDIAAKAVSEIIFLRGKAWPIDEDEDEA
jgi:hypothetical protein